MASKHGFVGFQQLCGVQHVRFRSLLLIAVIFWLFISLYLILGFIDLELLGQKKSVCNSLRETIDLLQSQIRSGTTDLEFVLNALKIQRLSSSTKHTPTSHPSYTHEILRRRALQNSREVRYAAMQLTKLSALVNELKVDYNSRAKLINKLLTDVHRIFDGISQQLEIDLDGLGRVNGAFEARVRGLDELAIQVRQRIHKLQNPSDCASAKYMLVDLNRPCAFGCNVHHLAYCFQVAYASGRTLLLASHSSHSPYTHWWMKNFLPLSSKCTVHNGNLSQDPQSINSADLNKDRVIVCPYINEVNHIWEFVPPAIPSDLAATLTRLHGAPFVWFIGQLSAYLMRPNSQLQAKLNLSINFPSDTPIVGIHVRRTDKINTEAQFHALEEYMVHVEEYFKFIDSKRQMMSRNEEWVGDQSNHLSPAFRTYSPPPVKRQVLIATDDYSLFKEARTKYPNYVFYGDESRAASAGVSQRREDSSILGIVTDIFALSHTDYLVCTFSSQVCRLAYELLQTRHTALGDASSFVRSLDDLYYFGGQQANPHEVLVVDPASGLRYGDLVSLEGNHWNGYAKVRSISTGTEHIAPAYLFAARTLVKNMSIHAN